MVRAACESGNFQKGILQLACGPVFVQQVVKRETSDSGVRILPNIKPTKITS